MAEVDLKAIEAEFLNQCGPCDFAMPGACNCAKRDYRGTMLDLVREVERLRSLAGEATEYTVSTLPEDDISASAFAIVVAYRGRGLWAVSRHRQCLGRGGEWDWESLPSARTDEWLAEHRFDLDTALRLARAEAPRIVCNGRTAAELLAMRGGSRG